MTNANFGKVANLYSKWRNDVSDQLYESLKIRNIDFSNKSVADLGCGTGILSRGMAIRGAKVFGIDPSIELLNVAKELDQTHNIDTTYIQSTSEVTQLDNESIDIVTTLRAWHWFDRVATLQEINRIIKKNGYLLVMDSGFIGGSSVIKDTVEFIKAYTGPLKAAGSKAESKQAINRFPVEWFNEWNTCGFDLMDCYKFYYSVSFNNEEWCGRVGTLSWLTNFDEQERNHILEELKQFLNERYDSDLQHDIPHGFYITILKKME